MKKVGIHFQVKIAKSAYSGALGKPRDETIDVVAFAQEHPEHVASVYGQDVQ